MHPRRKVDRARAEALAEQRRREDAAPRLRDAAPQLRSLRMKFADAPDEGRSSAVAYARPVIVATAAACFEVRCLEPRCDGRHDLTARVLDALRRSLPRFDGQSRCDGKVGDVNCTRTLIYGGEATYGS